MSNPSPEEAGGFREELSKHRGWVIAGGIFSIIVGLFAVTLPGYMSLVLEQFIGALCLVSGVFSIFTAIFGKEPNSRFWSILSGVLRVAVGLLLFSNVVAGVLALTIVVAFLFIFEGASCIFVAFRHHAVHGIGWMAANGIVALVLGGMLIARLPGDALWAIGLLYGINSLFMGVSLVLFGMGVGKSVSHGS
jgi:uncharacterized membrane protein HdeD (DUF308 family)